MGNCLRVDEKAVRVMKMDGKVLEYKSPVKVFQVLSEFKGHVISDTLIPGSNHLYPHTDLLSDRLYHLIPVKVTAQKKPLNNIKKKVSFSIPESTQQVAAAEKQQQPSTEEKVAAIESFRIKLVITKADLRNMIDNGLVSMDGSMTAAELETNNNNKEDVELVNSSDDDTDHHTIRSRPYLWKPSLVGIPEAEGNYCYS